MEKDSKHNTQAEMGDKEKKNALENVQKIIEEINNHSYHFENDCLYRICESESQELNYARMKGLMMLIGRAYAASPERRSYGTSDFIDPKKIGIEGKKENAPRWPVRGAGDGTGSFFEEIFRYFQEEESEYSCHEAFRQFLKFKQNMQNQSLKFDYSDKDKNLLENAIDCVLALNEAIRRASERFDGVPPITYTVTNKPPDESIEDYKDYKIDSEWLKDSRKKEELTIFSKLTKKGKKESIVTSPIRVKNQISFCSKFLHFCFPQTVFIIDQYSFDGGKRMMMTSRRGNMKNGTLMYGEDSLKITEGISKIIKAELKFEDENVAKFESDVKVHGNGNLDEKVTAETEEQSAKDYVEHCLRAYALCAYIKNVKSTYWSKWRA